MRAVHGERTSWASPDVAYEGALERYIRRALDPHLSRPLLDTLARFIATIAPAATVNALAHSLLALTVPGIPDLYQGSEGEHLTLVDPDNRRPVDYAALTTALAAPVASLAALLDDPGQAKLQLVRRTL
ncbi:MAG TPA: hypothetical protein VHN38_04355, partial [Immundisolibacter sp.]|nr:hypothetical protein [Immundisolibacter sp.]